MFFLLMLPDSLNFTTKKHRAEQLDSAAQLTMFFCGWKRVLINQGYTENWSILNKELDNFVQQS